MGLCLLMGVGACIDGARMEVELPPEFLGAPPFDVLLDVSADSLGDVEKDLLTDTPEPGDLLADADTGEVEGPDGGDASVDSGDVSGDACGPGDPCLPCSVDNDCNELDDGNLCNGRWVCESAVCVEQPDPVQCIDPGPATPACGSYECLQMTGECGMVPHPEGTSCDDGEPCSLGDRCLSGACVGGPMVACDDGSPCTLDTCAGGVCAYLPADGHSCDDGNLCTSGELCSGGICGSPTSSCECSENADCAAFDDGNQCTGEVSCIAGKCRVAPATIPDCGAAAGACQIAACDPAEGCVTQTAPDGSGCDDGDVCTVGGSCVDGACTAGTALDCGAPLCGSGTCGEQGCETTVAEDGACACEADADCAAFDDGKACTGAIVCVAGACVVDMEGVPDCSAFGNNPCVACEDDGQACVVTTLVDQTTCDDGDACTQDDVCVEGTCTGDVLDCEGDATCFEAICHPLTGCSVLQVGGACDDGSACTSETCHNGGCVQTFEKECADPSECLNSACDPQSGACVEEPAAGGCDDGDACTETDTCKKGECLGLDLFCDDGNLCTDNTCASPGGCEFLPNELLCEDGTTCTLGNTCESGSCSGGQGVCGCASSQDCVQFSEGDPCIGPLVCLGGLCVPNVDKVVSCDSSSNTLCLESVCSPNTGECSLEPRAEGKACDDGDACTLSDACLAGSCGGQAVGCDDANPCTLDTCEVSGCVHGPVLDADACDDGNTCTVDTVCGAGVCGGGENSCDCLTDIECEVFDDGDRCNGEVRCLAGACALDPSTLIVCEPNSNACTHAVCKPATGACLLQDVVGGLCEDGDPCTVEDVCAGGGCQGQVADCDDGNPCTLDICSGDDGACVAVAVDGACTDGNPCTSVDLCNAGTCDGTGNTCECEVDADCDGFGLDKCVATYVCESGGCTPVFGTAVTCSGDGDTACSFNQCEPNSGTCQPTVLTVGTECDDGDICTEQESCEGDGACTGQPLACDDGNPCTDAHCDGVGGCDPQVLADEADCDDGNACTTDEACISGECLSLSSACSCEVNADCPTAASLCEGAFTCIAGQCVQGVPVTCSVNPNPCRLNTCDPGIGECLTVDAPVNATCTDGDLCTLNDTCYNGICTGNVNQCDDGNPCTADACSAGICLNVETDGLPCDDGDLCTALEKCTSGSCGAGVFVCGCVVDVQCKVFDDGDACNGIWSCEDKKCTPDLSSEVICLDDPDDCQNTSCHPSLGSCFNQMLANDTDCTDSDECTQDDGCFQGACEGTAPPPCPDFDLTDCQVSACHPELGVCQPFDSEAGVACEDGEACTASDVCSGGNCTGLPVDCDDGSPCTVDDCSQDLGCLHTTLFGPCEDGDTCTEDTFCNFGNCVGGDNVCGCELDVDCSGNQLDLCAAQWVCDDGACVEEKNTAVVCDAPADPCLASACDLATGACIEGDGPDYTACDDEDGCTHADQCMAGSCAGTAQDCEDGNTCTVDSCVGGGCEHVLLKSGETCDDGSECNGEGLCDQGVCIPGGLAVCPCAADADCESFEDGNVCNGTLICAADGQCALDLATVVACPSDIAGCSTGSCDPLTGGCQSLLLSNGAGCDDGDICTIGDACQAGVCVALPVGCEDGDPCTLDACDAYFGCVHSATGGPCDDGDPCTVDTSCSDGVCVGSTNLCDDGIFCTNDGCQDGLGCINVPKSPLIKCEDNNACTVLDKCSQGTCQGQNVCGCATDVDCAASDDGDLCFGPLSCVAGECVRDPANFVTCPPDEACHYFSCDGSTGECSANPIKEGVGCEDGDACTENALCEAGVCAGELVVCDDAQPCQEVVCDSNAGCQASDTDESCDDGSLCTHSDRCVAGVCVGEPKAPLDVSFESGTAQGWSFKSNGSAVGWTVSSWKAFDGVYGLYGGNPTTGTMNDVPSSSYVITATMPAVTLGTGVTASKLSFLLYLDVEDAGCGADFLSVRVNGSEIFSRCDSTGGLFVPIEIDLGIFIGDQVVVSFVLNTVTADANNGHGAVIDNINLDRTCGVAP